MAANRGKKGRPGPSGGSRGRQRFALVLFAAVFVLLFVGFAIAEGLGSPSVPSGDVALVKGVPEQLGHISEEEFEVALEQQAAQAKLKKTPEPGEPKYEELKKGALEELLNAVWLEGQGEELGVEITEKEVETELEKIKKQSFPTPQAYKKFLKESDFTEADVNDRIRLQILGTKIQEQVSQEAPPPSSDEIAAYYEAEKEAKFTAKETREVRVIVNEDKSKIEAAKQELEKDHSPAGWKKAAKKYSSDPTTKSKGGLTPGVQEEFLPEQLKEPIFSAATGELIGPLKTGKTYLLLEVVNFTPAKTKSLAEAEPEVVKALEQEKAQQGLNEFVAEYEGKWRTRTFCASDFATEQCSNFAGSGRPASAPPGCYEANPPTPVTACPAPVTQTQPALPGTVTLLKPKGEQLAQRPFPEASAEAGEEVPTPEGAPEAAPEGSGEAAPPAEAEPPGE